MDAELKRTAKSVIDKIANFETLFDLGDKQSHRDELEKEMASSTFWNDQDKAKQVIQELKGLNTVLKPFEELSGRRTTSKPRSNWPRRPRPTSSTTRSPRLANKPTPTSRRSNSARCSADRTTTATHS